MKKTEMEMFYFLDDGRKTKNGKVMSFHSQKDLKCITHGRVKGLHGVVKELSINETVKRLNVLLHLYVVSSNEIKRKEKILSNVLSRS